MKEKNTKELNEVLGKTHLSDFEKYCAENKVSVSDNSEAFSIYVKNLLQGDFGVSYVISKDTSISVLLKNRVPVSFGIGLEAVSFGAVVGLILGILAALKKNSWLDTICTVISVLGVSLPSYVFALVMAYFIGYKAQWLPLLFDGKKFFASSIMPMLAGISG